ncbi:2'-5' RNA ligase [Chitinophaga niastensis]|uniref:2'-5' RNA ligase n=1 Tax=Chitinophaga niastensis TaxID=536980 RepID=A0A2P8HRP5_CHINA|nr:2'-5' RNA ligase family protein [Chitinophaga niastensis]PSL48887.1 2'-5' RNA ligase [Chitinophaga niastensis]
MRRGNNIQLTLFDLEDMYPSYSIVISPPKKNIEDIALLKVVLHQKIGLSPINLKSIAHISLLKLSCPDDDLFIINKVNRAISYQHRFSIKLDGADIFNHNTSKTLFIKINNPTPIATIHQLILAQFNRRRKINPHLTIARAIPNNDFKKITLSAFDYHDEFFCDRITILKKPIDSIRYKIIYEAMLEE